MKKCYKDDGRECNSLCAAFMQEQTHGTNCSELANNFAKAENSRYLGEKVEFLGATLNQALSLAMQAIPGARR